MGQSAVTQVLYQLTNDSTYGYFHTKAMGDQFTLSISQGEGSAAVAVTFKSTSGNAQTSVETITPDQYEVPIPADTAVIEAVVQSVNVTSGDSMLLQLNVWKNF